MDRSTAAGASAAFILIAFHAQKRKRRWWQGQLLQNGTCYGDNLMAELLLNDVCSFRNFVRLTKSDFEEVLCLVGPKIFIKNTNYRAAIPPSIRLMVALRYLATGDSFTSPHLFQSGLVALRYLATGDSFTSPHLFQSGWPFLTFHHISITIFSTRNVP
ncbi:hypothetical protein QE152_g30094 [Popillia japonica]|uniref:Uncharacterized protein n=1 Tax=Popillia japonica TaxID=7064 RepID=A0AAW1JGT1_POPJA